MNKVAKLTWLAAGVLIALVVIFSLWISRAQ